MPTKKPLTLSLIIPVYNEEIMLDACLQSVSSQTVMPDEVIVIDNNSTDNSVEIARKYKFVKVINEPEQGALYARTRGFNAAKFDLIGRIDADTQLEPNWVETAKKIMADKTIAAATGSSHFYDMPGSPWNHWAEDLVKNLLYKHEKNYPFLFGTNMIVRRSTWQSIKSELCDKKYIFEDADLAIHLYQTGKKLVYDINLRAGMSARRYSDTPWQFHKYNKLQSVTYKSHGINTPGSVIARFAYSVGYWILRPLSLAYDHKKQKLSLKKLLTNPNKARRHPFN